MAGWLDVPDPPPPLKGSKSHLGRWTGCRPSTASCFHEFKLTKNSDYPHSDQTGLTCIFSACYFRPDNSSEWCMTPCMPLPFSDVIQQWSKSAPATDLPPHQMCLGFPDPVGTPTGFSRPGGNPVSTNHKVDLLAFYTSSPHTGMDPPPHCCYRTIITAAYWSILESAQIDNWWNEAQWELVHCGSHTGSCDLNFVQSEIARPPIDAILLDFPFGWFDGNTTALLLDISFHKQYITFAWNELSWGESSPLCVRDWEF